MRIILALVAFSGVLFGDTYYCEVGGQQAPCSQTGIFGLNDTAPTLSYLTSGNHIQISFGSGNGYMEFDPPTVATKEIYAHWNMDDIINLPATKAGDYYTVEYSTYSDLRQGNLDWAMLVAGGDWFTSGGLSGSFDQGQNCEFHSCYWTGNVSTADMRWLEVRSELEAYFYPNGQSNNLAAGMQFQFLLDRFDASGNPDPFMAATPEPASVALIFLGIFVFSVYIRKQRVIA